MEHKLIKSLCLAATLAFLFFTVDAFAQPAGGGSNPDLVGQWDKDGDGKVSKTEWQRSEALFKKYDKNNSGEIDSDEKPQMPTSDLMDADGDKKVSKAEFLGPEDFFKQLDKNSDGYLTDDENSMSGSAGGAPGGAPQK